MFKNAIFWRVFLSVLSRDVKPDNILLDERGKGLNLLLYLLWSYMNLFWVKEYHKGLHSVHVVWGPRQQ